MGQMGGCTVLCNKQIMLMVNVNSMSDEMEHFVSQAQNGHGSKRLVL